MWGFEWIKIVVVSVGGEVEIVESWVKKEGEGNAGETIDLH